MACANPLRAFKTALGDVIFVERGDIVGELLLPCGRCTGCRLERSRQWAVRCMHEASLHKKNCFLTLTFDSEHCPRDMSLNYRVFQLFMKRFRKIVSPVPLRFYMCGEYGELFGRPHYHALIFGYDFPDKAYYSKSGAGETVYISDLLSKLWPFGMATIGECTFNSAAYVSRYIMKKVTGDAAVDHYRYVDLETGEIYQRLPEFNCMSRKPGIGTGWYRRYSGDVFPRDYVVARSRPSKPPRFYDKLLKRADPDMYDAVKAQRELDGYSRREDNLPARLAVKEAVAQARVKFYKRSVE
ncbi:MAG: replication initiator protein [Microviridae sp.]|nr:MAG: replication initiator protein [Microviridae sp.]